MRDSIRHVVGVMTGTSIDGIDAALVRIDGCGLQMRATLVRFESASLGMLERRLRDAAQQKAMTAGEFAKLAWEFGELHAEVIETVLRDGTGGDCRSTHPHLATASRLRRPNPLPPPQGEGERSTAAANLDLICVHGQTVFHQPPVSWQLMNPAPIAARFGCPIVFDLRQADLAAGGQGAPITPIADWILFRDEQKSRAIVNLGGFCNVTVLPEALRRSVGEIRAFDICACNQVLDAAARRVLGRPFDIDGGAARGGRAKPQAAEALHEILMKQRAEGRSLGTGDEGESWLNEHAPALAANDLMASAVEAIARCIVGAIQSHAVNEVILAGGGARNVALVEAIKRCCGATVVLSAELGVPIEAREAMAFAVLGALCADGVAIALPQVTGRGQQPIQSGVWCNLR